ncbi:MAG: hypothetical protein RL764_548 [Pseudomonadota bacterium]|jgi:hypothetical protein
MTFIVDLILSWLAMFAAMYLAILTANRNVLVIAGLAVGILNMVVHQRMGTTINPPFFAALLFGFALRSNEFLIQTFGEATNRWTFRAFIAGTVLGWLSFAQTVSLPSG